MSKVDAQRAMKVARLARTAAAPTPSPARPAPGRTAPVATPGTPPATTPGTAPAATVPDVVAMPASCGHRNMAGKECRRPAGHPEKSHRYS